jgi:hypothetical protein
MARPENRIETEEKRVRFPKPLYEELERLVDTGFFGATVNDAVVQLVSEAVRNAYAQADVVATGRGKYAELAQSRRSPAPRR